MDIVDLLAEDSREIEQVALLLLDYAPNTAAAIIHEASRALDVLSGGD